MKQNMQIASVFRSNLKERGYKAFEADYKIVLFDASVITCHYATDGENFRLEYTDPLTDNSTDYWLIKNDNLPVAIKEDVFKKICPDGTNEEKNIFLYGKDEGSKINDFKNWIVEHNICTPEITMEVFKKIGPWKMAQTRWEYKSVNGGRNSIIRLTRETDFYDVTIFRSADTTKILSILKVDVAAERIQLSNRYKQIYALAQKAGVGYQAASTLKDPFGDDETNIAALKAAKEVHEQILSDEICHELTKCGIARRTAAIRTLLGKHAEAFVLEGQIRNRRLAEFLANV